MPRLATYIEPPNVPRNRSSSDLSAWLHRESDGSYAPRRTVDDGTLGDATPGRIGIAEAPATLVSQHDAATPRAGIPPPPSLRFAGPTGEKVSRSRMSSPSGARNAPTKSTGQRPRVAGRTTARTGCGP